VLPLHPLLLMLVIVIAFPTARVAECTVTDDGPVTALLYSRWSVATSLVRHSLWWFAAASAGRIIYVADRAAARTADRY